MRVTLDWVDVSPEMLALYGVGACPSFHWPSQSHAFVYELDSANKTCRFYYDDAPTPDSLNRGCDRTRLILLLNTEAKIRIFGAHAILRTQHDYYLCPELRAIAKVILTTELPEAAATPYRLGKSIELLCETFRVIDQGRMVSLLADSGLSAQDGQLIAMAHEYINQYCSSPLTLESIAKAVGVNRTKLTKGFRAMFGCSVSDAIAEQRLQQAMQLLEQTDMPVSAIGYQVGYQSNASFSRAFSRYFGAPPRHIRDQRASV
jgi:AraC family transcriptional activator of pyochelin receptor